MLNETVMSQNLDISGDQSRPISNYSLDSKQKPITDKKVKDTNKKEKPKQNGGLKSFIGFVLKNFGILFVVILYTVGGAFLFKILEQHTEIQNCQSGEGEWNKLRIEYRSKIFNYIHFNTTPNPWLPIDNATIEAGLFVEKDGPPIYQPLLTEWVIGFRRKIFNISREYGYVGQDCEKQSSWTFFSALLFTITIMSTLGYGHVSPATSEGQIVCICYSLLGIPLFVISTVKISNLLGDLLVFFSTKILCFCCIKSKDDKKIDDEDEKYPQDWNGYENKDVLKVIDDDDENEEEYEQERFVPLIVVILVFVGYLVLGAWILTLIESDWDILEGSYFAFVSLSTIGFGDLVPGIDKVLNGDETEGGKNLVITSIYVYVGLAILGMCFQLIQDQMTVKFSLIIKKLNCCKREEKELQEQQDVIHPKQQEILENFSYRENLQSDLSEATFIRVKPKSESSC